MMNISTPHLKSQKNQNRRAALGWPAMKITVGGGGGGGGRRGGGLQLVCGQPTLALSSALVPPTVSFSVRIKSDFHKSFTTFNC